MSVYMANGDNWDHNFNILGSAVNELTAILSKYNDNDIIIGGGFNVHFQRHYRNLTLLFLICRCIVGSSVQNYSMALATPLMNLFI